VWGGGGGMIKAGMMTFDDISATTCL